MGKYTRLSFFALMLLFHSRIVYSQDTALIAFELPVIGLYSGVTNEIKIVAKQNEAISLDDVSISGTTLNGTAFNTSIEFNNGVFNIRPDSSGTIDIKVNTKNGVVRRWFKVKRIYYIASLSHHLGKNGDKMGPGEFKAQRGLSLSICCNFHIKETLIDFEIIRLPLVGLPQRVINMGNRFSNEVLEIIRTTEPGDVYVIRKIRYQMVDTKIHFADDMTFDIIDPKSKK